MNKAKKIEQEEQRQAHLETERKFRESQDKAMDIFGLSLVGLVVVLIVLFIFLPVRFGPINHADPRDGWVITEWSDFDPVDPVYRYRCEGTTLITEHTTRGVHTPTYFENDPQCVEE